METRTSQSLEFTNIGDTVREIERKFAVDPVHRNWKGRGEINVRCPNCNDKKYHLGLSFAKNGYNCFRCSFQGRLADFLRKNGIRYETKGQVFRSEAVLSDSFKIKMPIDFTRNEDIARKAKVYMASRGFDLSFLKKNFKIWPITNYEHHYFGYIIVELNNYAFYARKFLDLTPAHQRHVIRKSDPGMKLFYTYDKNNSNTILVVESMFNLIKAAQYGYDAVCIFGKGSWAAFVEYLRTHDKSKNLCLCFDKDVDMNSVEKFTKKIFKHFERIPLSYVDPSDMWYNDIADIKTKEELIKMINKKKQIEDVFLNSII